MKTLRFLAIALFLALLITSCQTTTLEEKVALAQEKMDLAYSEGDTKDTWNLREDADFEIEVYPGVWWVPANILGDSRYTNKQIAAIGDESPKVKKELIGNLYEAIQLFQVGGFAPDSDEDDLNVRVTDQANGYDWEKHCPGYYAVLLNRGNCSTDTNWLIYLLKDDFDEWGTFHFQESNGSGHVYNWFKVDGYYYFIDLTHYRNDFHNSAVEDGNIQAYRKTDRVLGNIHKATSPEAYAEYLRKTSNYPLPLIYMFKGIEVPDMTSTRSKTSAHMIMDKMYQHKIKILYHNPERISYGFYHNSTNSLNWGIRNKNPFAGITEF